LLLGISNWRYFRIRDKKVKRLIGVPHPSPIDRSRGRIVLETAVHGHADAIVTFNLKHFNPAAGKFGIEVITPRDALDRVVK
jgi:hypothetical protein